MIVLLAVAAWGLVALTAGLVMGEPFLRTGGALVLCLSVGAAFLLDRLTRVDSWEDHVTDRRFDYVLIDVSDIDWSSWPDHREDETRRAA